MDDVFSMYAYHQTQLENIAKEIVRNPGRGSLDITGYDDLSASDLKYIDKILQGMGLTLSESEVY